MGRRKSQSSPKHRRSRSRSRSPRHRYNSPHNKKSHTDVRQRSRSPREGSSHRRSSRPSASVSGLSYGQLESIVLNIINTGKVIPGIDQECLPEFDPFEGSMSAEQWVRKVNEVAAVFQWDSTSKVSFGERKLRGGAKLWYEAVPKYKLNWEAFSGMLVEAFPIKSFGQRFEEASQYRSSPGQDLQKYCTTKVEKIRKLHLNLREDKLVDLVIHGIQDLSIRRSLQARHCKTIVALRSHLEPFVSSYINRQIPGGKKKLRRPGPQPVWANESRKSGSFAPDKRDSPPPGKRVSPPPGKRVSSPPGKTVIPSLAPLAQKIEKPVQQRGPEPPIPGVTEVQSSETDCVVAVKQEPEWDIHSSQEEESCDLLAPFLL